jgi:hypothetical protein
VNDDPQPSERPWRPAAGEEREWIRQSNLMYGGLIGIGIVMVQPFLTATSLGLSAWICVVAFSVAIPLLAGLVLVAQQEAFARRASGSMLVSAARGIAVFFAFTGVVSGFWHITWIAGVGVLVAGVFAVTAHSAGYTRLMCGTRRRPSTPPASGVSDG